MEVLFEKNKEIYLDYFKISKSNFLKKRIKFTLLFLMLGGMLVYSVPNQWTIILFPLLVILGFKLPYIDLLIKKSHQDIIKQHMFPTFLRYFISLIDTQGNVYQTIKATIPYMQEPLRGELIELIKKLDSKNVKNFDAFNEFADFIGSSDAHMVMNMIYQFYEEGTNKDDLDQLENTIRNLQNNKINERIEYNVGSLNKHADPILLYSVFYILAFTISLFFVYLSEISF